MQTIARRWTRKSGHVNTKLLVEIRKELRQKYTTNLWGQEFVTRNDAFAIMTRDRVHELLRNLSWYKKDDLLIIWPAMRLVLCVLITIRFDRWQDFETLFIRRIGRRYKPRIFDDPWLPITGQNTVTSFLPESIRDDFIREQYVFLPIIIEKFSQSSPRFQERLPITTAPTVQLRTQGRIERVWVEKGCLMNNVTSLNTKRELMACRIVPKTTASEQRGNITNGIELESLRKRVVKNRGIVPCFAILVYRLDTVVLSEWANTSLNQFLQYPERFLHNPEREQLHFSPFNILSEAGRLADALQFLHRGVKLDQKTVMRCVCINLEPRKILVYLDWHATPHTYAVGHWKLSEFSLASVDSSGERQTLVPAAASLYSDHTQSPNKPLAPPNPHNLRSFQPPEAETEPSAATSVIGNAWSFGCLLLMVLAFTVGGPDEVHAQLACRSDNGDNHFYHHNTLEDGRIEIKPQLFEWIRETNKRHAKWVSICSGIALRLMNVDQLKRPSIETTFDSIIELLRNDEIYGCNPFWKLRDLASPTTPKVTQEMTDAKVVQSQDNDSGSRSDHGEAEQQIKASTRSQISERAIATEYISNPEESLTNGDRWLDNDTTLPDLTEGTTANDVSINSRYDEKECSVVGPVVTSITDQDQNLGEGDSRSFISLDDDISSRSSLQRPRDVMLAEDRLAFTLSKHTDLQLLCKGMLSAMTEERFIRNFRRLLKSFYLDLLPLANTVLEKGTVSLLRRRAAREHIAKKIIYRLEPQDLDSADMRNDKQLLQQKADILEAWIADRFQHSEYFNNPNHSNMPVHSALPDIINSNVEDSSSNESDEGNVQIPAVEKMQNFVLNSHAFYGLLTNAYVLTMPSSLNSLTRILMTIPRKSISFHDKVQPGISHKIRTSIEKLSGCPWRWSPLSFPEHELAKNHSRIRWQCHCGFWLYTDVTQQQAAQLTYLLRLRGPLLHTNHLCRGRSKTWRRKIYPEDIFYVLWAVFLDAGMVVGTALHSKSLKCIPTTTILVFTLIAAMQLLVYKNYVTTGEHSGAEKASKDHKQASVGDSNNNAMNTAVSKSANITQTDMNLSQRHIIGQQQSSSQSIDISDRPASYVLLGVKRKLFSIAHLDIKMIQDDWRFFSELRKKYQTHRGKLRCWFSIWQLNHCDFVKFEKFGKNRIAPRGKALPETLDYEYAPRPPNAENPPISVHEFEQSFSACDKNCPFSRIHECDVLSSGDLAIRRIPKRIREWEVQAKHEECDFAWGLEALHYICAMRVMLYNVLIILLPVAFWAWWQGRHPTDMQNASIPATIVVALLALFWTLTGVVKVLREPSS